MDKNEIDNRIEKTLESLDGIQRASPGPFFFTRLYVRMNRQTRNFWEEMGSFLAKPVVALAGLAVIVFLNVSVIYSNNEPATDQSQSQSEQVITSVYEIENIKP